ncbi:MAG: hypothetical protein KGL02_03720 [Acidobacteriota bacterium]|nr:hypothetical protein [Acidobacteriota bacterium]MDE3171233.1 hypothetical protein [Acidobacteriota bacterium]
MPALPWKSFAKPEEGREYAALLTFLPLKHFRALPQFMLLTFQTQRQLASSKGLLGYALDADVSRRNFWTLSAWEDRQSIMKFAHAMPHEGIMKKLAPAMRQTQFIYWNATAREIPLRWDAAKARAAAPK